MIKGLKICGISDPETLNYILSHPHPPNFIGFITNYVKSKRFVDYKKLINLINIKKRNVNFVCVLVKPSIDILKKIVLDQAKLANKAKLDAIVCSAQEVDIVKKVFKKEIITPGIRFNTKENDQKRVVTPNEAYKNGSDWLVIGRPITKGNIKNNLKNLINHLN